MIIVACPVCTHNSLTSYKVGRTPMWLCGNCGTTVTPTDEQSALRNEHYQKKYFLVDPRPFKTEHHRYFRYPEYKQLIMEVRKYMPPPASWLDVGCDHGFFIDDARRLGYAVSGIEPGERARNYARSIGLQVAEDINLVQGKFDVISMWHVLEHIPSPIEFLQNLHGMLETNGVLCIRVPDFDCLSRKLLKDNWIWFLPFLHPIHYNLQSLTTMLQSLGFTIELAQRRMSNSFITRRSYGLANRVFRDVLDESATGFIPSLRRLGADITSQELFVIARRK
ncbi:MAG: class I SAM-dependent methyltransferase [Ignavibacteria bacterium]|nr:class I SAM-dependent methyltransferase [Ignavibacteria bacterium]